MNYENENQFYHPGGAWRCIGRRMSTTLLWKLPIMQHQH